MLALSLGFGLILLDGKGVVFDVGVNRTERYGWDVRLYEELEEERRCNFIMALHCTVSQLCTIRMHTKLPKSLKCFNLRQHPT